MWLLLAIILFLLSIAYYVFFVPFNFSNFELVDRRSKVNTKKRTRKYANQVVSPYPNGWFALEQSKNLKPGTAKNIDCLGENFVVFRSKSNEVFVLDAYCPHMGANLGVGGMVKGNCIECPFHAWRFSGETGECVDIPYAESCDDVKKQAKVKKWISKEANGFIFVWYHAEIEEPWELPVFDFCQNLKLQYTFEFIIHTHIQEFFENINDQAHLVTVHGASVFAGRDHQKSRLPSIVNQTVEVKWTPDPKDFFKSFVDTQFYFKLFNKYEVYKAQTDISIYGPGLVIFVAKTSIGDVSFVAAVTPLDAFSFRASFHAYSPFILAWFAKFSAYTLLVNLARDKSIWDMKQFKKNPLLVKEEKSFKEAQIWYTRFYSPNSKTFEEARNTMEW